MENTNKIQQELIEVSPSVAQIGRNEVYSVSSSYFYDFPDRVLNQIRCGAEPVYYLSQLIPYNAPADYFETLPNAILNKIWMLEEKSDVYEETERVSPLLNRISKEPVFSLPVDYFTGLSAKSSEPVLAKVKAVPVRTISFKLLKYAAAAGITGLIALGAFLFTGKEPVNNQTFTSNEKVEVKKLSEDDILQFLQSSSGDEATALPQTLGEKQKEIKKLVSKMSEKDLRNFLQENGEIDGI